MLEFIAAPADQLVDCWHFALILPCSPVPDKRSAEYTKENSGCNNYFGHTEFPLALFF